MSVIIELYDDLSDAVAAAEASRRIWHLRPGRRIAWWYGRPSLPLGTDDWGQVWTARTLRTIADRPIYGYTLDQARAMLAFLDNIMGGYRQQADVLATEHLREIIRLDQYPTR